MPYTYLGTLGYLTHDATREQPVHFQWQLMDWPAPATAVAAAGVSTTPADIGRADDIPSGTLERKERPTVRRRGGRTTAGFRSSKQAVHADSDARNAALGLAGELLVVQHETDLLCRAGRPDLADRIVHIAIVEGDSAGYDVRSFTPDGSARFIEVKTTRGPATTAFFVSPNQVECSRVNGDSYVLRRVFHYSIDNNSGEYYDEVGRIDESFSLSPTEFRASLSTDGD